MFFSLAIAISLRLYRCFSLLAVVSSIVVTWGKSLCCCWLCWALFAITFVCRLLCLWRYCLSMPSCIAVGTILCHQLMSYLLRQQLSASLAVVALLLPFVSRNAGVAATARLHCLHCWWLLDAPAAATSRNAVGCFLALSGQRACIFGFWC